MKKSPMNNKKPFGIKIIALILFLLGLLFLLGVIFFIRNSSLINESLIPLGLSSIFVICLLMALMFMAFFGGYGLERGLRAGWLAAIIFFGFFILMDAAAFFIDKAEVRYEIGLLSLVSLFYLSKKSVRNLY